MSNSRLAIVDEGLSSWSMSCATSKQSLSTMRLEKPWWRHSCRPLRIAKASISFRVTALLSRELASNKGTPFFSLTRHPTPNLSRSKKIATSTLSLKQPSRSGFHTMLLPRKMSLMHTGWSTELSLNWTPLPSSQLPSNSTPSVISFSHIQLHGHVTSLAFILSFQKIVSTHMK